MSKLNNERRAEIQSLKAELERNRETLRSKGWLGSFEKKRLLIRNSAITREMIGLLTFKAGADLK